MKTYYDKSSYALGIVLKFIKNKFTKKEENIIVEEIKKINIENIEVEGKVPNDFFELQQFLSKVNEKSEFRKQKGVYYTPQDVVSFMINNTIKLWSKKLKTNNFHIKNQNGISYIKTCFELTLFDPTCGLGEFVLSMLDLKIDLLEMHREKITKKDVKKILKTLFGNDINIESVKITKLRILLKILERFGVKYLVDISQILNDNLQNYDFIQEIENERNKYDIIIGNPPYVEDSKYNLGLKEKYGNIYANVLDNSTKLIKKDGVIAFIIPISYISTPRMKKIRELMLENFENQYIINFSDRPDSLFISVHQKLSIVFFGGKMKGTNNVYTSTYNYWYKSERDILFDRIKVTKNNFINQDFIPKLGDKISNSIYKKIMNYKINLFEEMTKENGEKLYLNMRATFWIKLFFNKPKSLEYKEFKISTEKINLIYCILNSSLFWWYWICISDCWHITKKELKMFSLPDKFDSIKIDDLAMRLSDKLEKTKRFIGTKQIDFEYKHKECIDIINEIDDEVNKLYRLTEKEEKYIKSFSLKYRIGEK